MKWDRNWGNYRESIGPIGTSCPTFAKIRLPISPCSLVPSLPNAQNSKSPTPSTFCPIRQTLFVLERYNCRAYHDQRARGVEIPFGNATPKIGLQFFLMNAYKPFICSLCIFPRWRENNFVVLKQLCIRLRFGLKPPNIWPKNWS